MAELSYDDVRRAAQDAVRDLQNVVYGLKTNSEDVRRSVQQMGGSGQNQMNEFINKLSTIQNQVTNLDVMLRNHNNSIYVLQTLQQTLGDMQRRMSALEDFVQFTYRYITSQQQAADKRGARGNS